MSFLVTEPCRGLSEHFKACPKASKVSTRGFQANVMPSIIRFHGVSTILEKMFETPLLLM